MSASYAELLGKLHFYKRDYASYTRCLSRGIELLVSGRPEEVVRQALLYYLIHGSGLYPGRVDISVEQDNLDIALYRRPEEESFFPCWPPVVIIEVKRERGAMQGSIVASKIKAAEDGWEQWFKVEKLQLDGLVGPSSLVIDPAKEKPVQEEDGCKKKRRTGHDR